MYFSCFLASLFSPVLTSFLCWRYERVKAVQKTGETTRDLWHKTDWNKVKEDPASIALPREDWIHFHDAEVHAEEVFDDIFKKHLGKTNSQGGKEGESSYVEHLETVRPITT